MLNIGTGLYGNDIEHNIPCSFARALPGQILFLYLKKRSEIVYSRPLSL